MVAADQAVGDPAVKVAAAIDQLRGVHIEAMSAAEKSALGQRLDRAWDTLYDHPDAAKKAILAVLATERDDGFLLVDLANLLTTLDPRSLEAAAGGLSRADVTAHPSGTFHAASRMAAGRCGACLPAVIRILEIEDAHTQIEQHALPIDPQLMLTFTLGQYGDDAIGPVSAKLASDNCVVRGNAALALGLLQPRSIPGEIRRIAAGDPCDEARRKAWIALGLLDDPLLAGSATARLESSPKPSKDERLGIVLGLASSFSPAARKPLQALAADPEADVASAAKEGLDGFEEMEKNMAQVKMQRASGPSPKRSKVLRRIEKAVKEGRIELEGGAGDLLAALTAADIPLLNRARALVLGRLSDECLYEYYPLTYAVRALRRYLAPPGEPPMDRD
ncbi:MAG: hypothetical protein HYS34_11160 [Acidobacteria bacterium]|nr:hypothetical protein [Acidobacteriota bacterium]